jgi:protein-tyrosine-phosphatase
MKQKTLSKEAKQAPKYLIYFVCTSNTCRSPMCVGLAREHVKQNSYPFEIRSFGVWSGDGDKASENSVRILRRLGNFVLLVF